MRNLGKMLSPRFYVCARVIAREGTIKRWQEILVPLCNVSKTEPKGVSYYWGQEYGGSPDIIWGLEGYTDSSGFYDGHPSSDVFKAQMKIVDDEKLLAEDYDLKHYEFAGGWLKKPNTVGADNKNAFFVFTHVYTANNKRDQMISRLNNLASDLHGEENVWSCGILKALNDQTLVSIFSRFPNGSARDGIESSKVWKEVFKQAEVDKIVTRWTSHAAIAFNGHIDVTPICEQ